MHRPQFYQSQVAPGGYQYHPGAVGGPLGNIPLPEHLSTFNPNASAPIPMRQYNVGGGERKPPVQGQMNGDAAPCQAKTWAFCWPPLAPHGDQSEDHKLHTLQPDPPDRHRARRCVRLGPTLQPCLHRIAKNKPSDAELEVGLCRAP